MSSEIQQYKTFFIPFSGGQYAPNSPMDSSYTLQVIHKRDTVEFFAENLVKALNQISYYMQVKGRIYPEEEVFKPDMITEEPILSN